MGKDELDVLDGFIICDEPDEPDRPDGFIIYDGHEQLKNSIAFDLNLTGSDEGSDEELVKDIANVLEVNVSETLEHIIRNILYSFQAKVGIYYSRKPNHYVEYKEKWYTYGRMIKLMDNLEERGFIVQMLGDTVRRTQFISNWRFVQMIENYENKIIIERKIEDIDYLNYQMKMVGLKTKSLLVLKAKKDKMGRKRRLKVPITTKNERMKKKLRKYNEFINSQNITVRLKKEDRLPSTLYITLFDQLLKKRLHLIKKGTTLDIKKKNLKTKNLNIDLALESVFLSLFPLRESQPVNVREKLLIHGLSEKRHINFLLELSRFTLKHRSYIKSKDSLKYKIPLNAFGVDDIEIGLGELSLYRVFNEGSFSKGGRFYGGIYQGLPSAVRKDIFINGSETVELDFSGFHLRLMYHLNGLEYTDDPYSIGTYDRKVYKYVCLVLVNEPNRYAALGAIKNKLEEGGVYLSDEEIKTAVELFRTKHKPILNLIGRKGNGRKMQFKDSQIAERIFMNLIKKKIPVLGIHDSFIVEEKHKEVLYNQMVESYEKETGFKPVIH